MPENKNGFGVRVIAWAKLNRFTERGIAYAACACSPGEYLLENSINYHREWLSHTPGVNIPMQKEINKFRSRKTMLVCLAISCSLCCKILSVHTK